MARSKTTIEMFHGEVFYVLHMEFDVKDKKLFCNRENKLASFEFHLRPCEGPDIKFLKLKKAPEQSNWEITKNDYKL